ncbi:MAG: hypothetical protein ACI4AK_06475 [Lepagella sp.]
MKTSFYFVLWIMIYPLLEWFGIGTEGNQSFIIALLAVFGISYLITRLMPATINYENVTHAAPYYEDVFTGNVPFFMHRIKREMILEIVTSIYFLSATFCIAWISFANLSPDWITLALFGLFTYQAIHRSYNHYKVYSSLREDPTPQQCAEVLQNSFGTDPEEYSQQRMYNTYEEMLPPRPKHYTLFRVVSSVFAIAALLLGIGHIIWALVLILGSSIAAASAAVMLLLYGSLAAYYGIHDLVEIISSKPKAKTIIGQKQ